MSLRVSATVRAARSVIANSSSRRAGGVSSWISRTRTSSVLYCISEAQGLQKLARAACVFERAHALDALRDRALGQHALRVPRELVDEVRVRLGAFETVHREARGDVSRNGAAVLQRDDDLHAEETLALGEVE